jgi:uncharacterized membrane protein
MTMTQNRWKSKVLWAALGGLVLTAAGHLGVYDLIGVAQTVFQTILDTVLMALTAFGVLNNPTDSANF